MKKASVENAAEKQRVRIRIVKRQDKRIHSLETTSWKLPKSVPLVWVEISKGQPFWIL